MSYRQGVIKRDFIWPLQQAIVKTIRGAVVPANSRAVDVSSVSQVSGLSQAPTTPDPKPIPIFDFMGVPKNQALPYITGPEVLSSTNQDLKESSAEEIVFQIHVWSRYNGQQETGNIVDQILKVMTQSYLDMTSFGFNLFSLRKDNDNTLFDGGISHRVLRFRAMIEDVQTSQPF